MPLIADDRCPPSERSSRPTTKTFIRPVDSSPAFFNFIQDLLAQVKKRKITPSKSDLLVWHEQLLAFAHRDRWMSSRAFTPEVLAESQDLDARWINTIVENAHHYPTLTPDKEPQQLHSAYSALYLVSLQGNLAYFRPLQIEMTHGIAYGGPRIARLNYVAYQINVMMGLFVVPKTEIVSLNGTLGILTHQLAEGRAMYAWHAQRHPTFHEVLELEFLLGNSQGHHSNLALYRGDQVAPYILVSSHDQILPPLLAHHADDNIFGSVLPQREYTDSFISRLTTWADEDTIRSHLSHLLTESEIQGLLYRRLLLILDAQKAKLEIEAQEAEDFDSLPPEIDINDYY